MPTDADRPLVGIKLKAGLGNQMFIYAAGMTMAARIGGTLLCDTRHFDRPKARQDRRLALEAFGIQLQRGAVPPHTRMVALASKLRLRREPFRGAEHLRTRVTYDPRFHEIDHSCVLRGFFQSWRFFEGHEEAVRATFDIDRLASERTAAVAAEIASVAYPVALHIRRGDYAKSPQSIATFGLLGRDYYDAARQAIEAQARVQPTYFVFSDEPAAALAELKGWTNIRPVRGFNELEDLRLMALCRSFIIANSTFSWWAAWLGRSTEKQVVASRTWFGPAYRHPQKLEDRLLPDWTAI